MNTNPSNSQLYDSQAMRITPTQETNSSSIPNTTFLNFTQPIPQNQPQISPFLSNNTNEMGDSAEYRLRQMSLGKSFETSYKEKKRAQIIKRQKADRAKKINELRAQVLNQALQFLQEETPQNEEEKESYQNTKPSLFYSEKKYHSNKPKKKEISDQYKTRKGYATKIMMPEYFTQLPDNFFNNWLMYNKPDGQKILVYTTNFKTIFRNKNGYLIKEVQTLLPYGSKTKEKSQQGKTMLQGIYSERDNTLYVIDILIWNDELHIDAVAEFRIFWINSKINEIQNKDVISPSNQVKLASVYACRSTPEALEKLYYGLYYDYVLFKNSNPSVTLEMMLQGQTEFSKKINQIVQYITNHNLAQLLNLENILTFTEDVVKRICCAFSFDCNGNVYLKDGISFIHSECFYLFGINSQFLQWKDSLTSPYFSSKTDQMTNELQCVLHLNRKYLLETFEEYILGKIEIPQGFQVNRNYLCSFDHVDLNSEEPTLIGIQPLKTSGRILPDNWSQIRFKYISLTNPYTFQKLFQQLKNQEEESQQEMAQIKSLE